MLESRHAREHDCGGLGSSPAARTVCSADSAAAALQSSRDGRRSLSFHSARGPGLPRRDPLLAYLQEAIMERSPELRSLHLEKLVGRGSFGRVYKGASPLT